MTTKMKISVYEIRLCRFQCYFSYYFQEKVTTEELLAWLEESDNEEELAKAESIDIIVSSRNRCRRDCRGRKYSEQ